MNKSTRDRHLLVVQFGGKCQICDYSKCIRALQFHHSDSSEKKLWSKDQGGANPREVEAHPERFMLLCANCHFEIHAEESIANRVFKKCLTCSASFQVKPAQAVSTRKKFCSKKCLFASHSVRAKTIENLAIRLFRRVRKTDACWEWTGRLQKNKEAVMGVTEKDGYYHPVTARQIALRLALNSHSIPKIQLRIRCKNLLCVRINKDHIWHPTLDSAVIYQPEIVGAV